VKKFASDLQQVSGFFFTVSSTNKTDRHDIAEILLKVVLNTITITHLLGIGERGRGTGALSFTPCLYIQFWFLFN
jgi:hypothetical protein